MQNPLLLIDLALAAVALICGAAWLDGWLQRRHPEIAEAERRVEAEGVNRLSW